MFLKQKNSQIITSLNKIIISNVLCQAATLRAAVFERNGNILFGALVWQK